MAKGNERASIVFYFEWLDHLSLLSADDGMTILYAVRDYVTKGSTPDLQGASRMAFSFIKSQLDRDTQKWDEIRKKRIDAGRTGAEVTNARRQKSANSANAVFADECSANSAVNVNANGNVNGTVNGCIIADKPPSTRFIPPTLDDVKAYCVERGNGVDPVRFYDYNEARGWMIGKNKMKNWKAAVRTWERGGKTEQAADVAASTPRREYRTMIVDGEEVDVFA